MKPPQKTRQNGRGAKPKPKPKSTARRRTKKPAPYERPPPFHIEHGPDVPHWIPDDCRWEQMSQKLRDAVSRILEPAYRRFVHEAPGELERTVGLTLVHLMWLEICEQIKLGGVVATPESIVSILQNPEEMLERHLRLATVKCQTAELLTKIRVIERMAPVPAQENPPSALPPPVDVLCEPSPLLSGEGQGARAVSTNEPQSLCQPAAEQDRFPDTDF